MARAVRYFAPAEEADGVGGKPRKSAVARPEAKARAIASRAAKAAAGRVDPAFRKSAARRAESAVAAEAKAASPETLEDMRRVVRVARRLVRDRATPANMAVRTATIVKAERDKRAAVATRRVAGRK